MSHRIPRALIEAVEKTIRDEIVEAYHAGYRAGAVMHGQSVIWNVAMLREEHEKAEAYADGRLES